VILAPRKVRVLGGVLVWIALLALGEVPAQGVGR
jgi:hypothetical protein